MQTELDPESAVELLNLCEEEFSESRYEREVQYRREEYSTVPDLCREHPDEQLGYFCFDCESECICAECVIHGQHRGHEVMQIKKAYPIVRDKVEEIFLSISNKIDEIELRAEKIETQKKDIIDQGNAAKQQVLVSFEDLRTRIERKEKEIVAQIDRIIEESMKETENYAKIIMAKGKAMENISETVKKIMNSDSQIELLDFYAENRDKIYENTESELSTLGAIDRSTNLRCVISPSSLADHIESIKAVQLQISALKCIDDPLDRKSSTERSKRFQQKLLS